MHAINVFQSSEPLHLEQIQRIKDIVSQQRPPRLPEAPFEMMIGTNVAGYFFVTQQAVIQMRQQKSGHIVCISTVLTDQPLAGAPISLPVITKSTMPAFSRALAMECVADGIRANTISLGVVNTPMHANDDHEVLKKLHPIRRLVEVSEIVDAVLYLESAGFVTGEILHVDGGQSAGH